MGPWSCQARDHQLFTARSPILSRQPLDEQLDLGSRKRKRDVLEHVILSVVDPDEQSGVDEPVDLRRFAQVREVVTPSLPVLLLQRCRTAT